jgi:hypothetical protein
LTSDLTSELLSTMATAQSRLVPHIKPLTEPHENSRAHDERASVAEEADAVALLELGIGRAHLALDVAGDAIGALQRVLVPPPARFAAGGVGRDALESAALALWLVGDVNFAKERLDRVTRIRDRDLEEEGKLSSQRLVEEPNCSELQEAVEWHEQELSRFGQQVANVQLTIKPMINSTDLAKKMLGASYECRLYLGLSHGNRPPSTHFAACLTPRIPTRRASRGSTFYRLPSMHT